MKSIILTSSSLSINSTELIASLVGQQTKVHILYYILCFIFSILKVKETCGIKLFAQCILGGDWIRTFFRLEKIWQEISLKASHSVCLKFWSIKMLNKDRV